MKRMVDMINEKTATFIRKRIFFYLGFLLLIILALILIEPFFTTIMISLISVILLKPIYNIFFGMGWVKERSRIATTLTMLSFLFLIVAPIYLIVSLIAGQVSETLSNIGSLEVDVPSLSLQDFIGASSFSEAVIEGVAQLVEIIQELMISIALGLVQWLVTLASSIPTFLVQLMIFIAVVASLLPVYDDMVEMSQRVSPIGYELGELYNRKITAMVKSLATGVFLIAIIQGSVMGVFYWLAGMDYVFLLTLFSIMLAIIPMIGISWLVIAIAIASFIFGNPTQAYIVLFGFYGVANWVDVLLRPKFISKEAHVHTTLLLLSIFGGLAWAGIMGMFYGPIIMLLLVTTIEIYVEQFAQDDGEQIGSVVSSHVGKNED